MLIVGRTKIPYNQLFYLNRVELKALIKGHELDQKDLIESLRMHAMIGLQPHLKKGTHLDAKSIWSLPWDRKEKPYVSTNEDLEKAKKLIEIASKLKKDGKSPDRS
jgi:hypothetical protein